uniref:Uncharacterized protein n=1 Tax=Arion vulgaris TaxID=1028688 RepID=A0A0B7B727_9EUPU
MLQLEQSWDDPEHMQTSASTYHRFTVEASYTYHSGHNLSCMLSTLELTNNKW